MKIMFRLLFILFFFISLIISNNESFSYNEKIYNRLGFSFNLDYQLYAGKYRDLTKNKFRDFQEIDANYIGDNSYIDNYVIFDKKGTTSMGISVFYDLIFNFSDNLRPFIGLNFDAFIPITNQNKFYEYSTQMGNFIDVSLRIGNIFKIKTFFDIGVYVNAGLASVMWVGNGSEIYGRGLGSTYDLPTEIKIGVGYMFGGGLDFIIKEHYFIGLFYNYRQMLKGKDGKDATKNVVDTSSVIKDIISKTNDVYTSKYSAHTFGVRLGGMLKF